MRDLALGPVVSWVLLVGRFSLGSNGLNFSTFVRGILGLRWERWEVLVAFEGGWVGVEAWVGHFLMISRVMRMIGSRCLVDDRRIDVEKTGF